MKNVFFIGWFLIIAPVLSFAQTEEFFPSDDHAIASRLNVRVNCVLRQSLSESCPALKDQFFKFYASQVDRVEGAAEKLIVLDITDETTGTGVTRYWFNWKKEGSTDTLRYAAEIPAIDAIGTITKLVELHAAKGLVLFLSLQKTKINDEGQILITAGAAGMSRDGQDGGIINRLAKSPLYFSFGLSGSSSANGEGTNRFSSGSKSVSFNSAWIKKKYKIQLKGNLGDSRQSLPDGNGGMLVASNQTTSHKLVGVYSLSTRWSVAIINSSEKNPGANINRSNETQVGCEWTLVPFRTTQNKEIAIRVGTSQKTMQLGLPNEFGNTHEKIYVVGAMLYTYWVLFHDRVQFTGFLHGSRNMTYFDEKVYAVGAFGSVNYRINRAISLNGMTSYNYSTNSMTYPARPDFSNPLQTAFLRGQAGRSFMMQGGITITLGNDPLYQRDRRWLSFGD